MEKKTYTAVLGFGDETSVSGFIKMDLDKERNPENFLPGVKIYFVLQHGTEIEIKNIQPTSGKIVATENVILKVEDVFSPTPENDKADLSWIPMSNPAFSFFGNTPEVEVEKRSLKFINQLPAICRANYQAEVLGFEYTPPYGLTLKKDEEWPVNVVCIYEAKKND